MFQNYDSAFPQNIYQEGVTLKLQKETHLIAVCVYNLTRGRGVGVLVDYTFVD